MGIGKKEDEKFILYLNNQKQNKTEFTHKVMFGKPQRIIQNKFTEIFKDVELLKNKTEMLGSRL
jgi:hypothetical protein